MFGFSQNEKDEKLFALVSALDKRSGDLRDVACKSYEDVIEAMRKLLNKGASVSKSFPQLFEDSKNQSYRLQAISLFIDAGADVNQRPGVRHATLLHLAVENNFYEGIKLLIDKGAKANVVDDDGVSPAMKAIRYQYWKCVSTLLEAETRPVLANNDGDTLLHYAASRQADGEIVSQILSTGVDINALSARGNTALHIALEEKQTNLAQQLLECPAINVNTLNKQEHSVLFTAIRSGLSDVSEQIMRRAKSVDDNAFHEAIRQKNIRMVRTLLSFRYEQGTLSQEFLNASLRRAAETGSSVISGILLDAGAQVNGQDKSTGMSALMHAAKQGHIDIIDVLVRQGADLLLKDQHNLTALDHAETAKATKSVEFFFNLRSGRLPLQDALSDRRMKKLNNYCLLVEEEGGLSLTFNFWTQQVIYKDTNGKAGLAVRNFSEIQRKEAIDDAHKALIQLGGNPPDYAYQKADKVKPRLDKALPHPE